MKGLSGSASPYLREAARQPVNWLPYGGPAFDLAAQQNKPVFLSSGAAWCHWCHVQAKESFKDPEVAAFLNENFICVKVDMDERPDVDRRYQEAVHAMGLAGGWPLSIFLTPEGRPFFGGTYFPPKDSGGRPGFMKVLMQVSEFYKLNGDKAKEHGAKVMEFIRPEPLNAPLPGPEFLDHALGAVLAGYDAEEGGFGDHPKFPAPGALLFLAGRVFLSDSNEMAGLALKKTLSAMAAGGIHDQLGGGFHRYSTDRQWIIPHFEKLAEMNAWLLRNYCEGFAIFGDENFARAARGIIDYAGRSLTDPAGGFYSSQDADTAPGEEGLYYSWSAEEMKEALGGPEAELAAARFIHPGGEIHGQPGRYVLFEAHSLDSIAEKTGIGKDKLEELFAQIKRKLFVKREERKPPFVDTTIYSSVNGAFISAYLFAWRVLGGPEIKEFALKSLERVLSLNMKNKELMRTGQVEGQLDDYAHMTGALLDAYECTGKKDYLEVALSLAGALVNNFWDGSSGGFFDTRREIAGLRLKRFEDVPGPSANTMAAWHLLRLHLFGPERPGAGKRIDWLEYAQKCLEAFTEGAKKLGMHAGSYFSALDGFYNRLSVLVEDAPDGGLARAALNTYRPYLAIGHGEGDRKPRAVPCIRNRCLAPVTDPGKLAELIRNFRYS